MSVMQVDNIKLVYDNVTRTTSNSPGVDLRVPGWGDPFVVEWLDPTKASAGSYFKDIGNALVSLGYERNVSIRGAPYDFRKAPSKIKSGFCLNVLPGVCILVFNEGSNSGFT